MQTSQEGGGTTTVLVVPCYNERDRLKPGPFGRFLDEHPGFEILFVDDGSSDGTGDLLESLARDHHRIGALSLEENSGKAEAVRRGVLSAVDSDTDYVGFWDADLATPLEDAVDFLAYLEARPELLAVIGSRVRLLGRDIERSAARHYVGRVFATGASLALDLPVYDTQCGAKLFRVGPEVQEAFSEPFGDRWIFDVELIGRLVDASDLPGERLVHEWPLLSWKDEAGSKVKKLDGVRAAWALFRLWMRRRRQG